MRCAFRERSYKITKRAPNNMHYSTPKMNTADTDIPTNGSNPASLPIIFYKVPTASNAKGAMI
jgi:hypothetical protein